jgi:hypothetical protein
MPNYPLKPACSGSDRTTVSTSPLGRRSHRSKPVPILPTRTDFHELSRAKGPKRQNRRFATQPRTACARQSIDGEVVARAPPAMADAEPGFRGGGPPETCKHRPSTRGDAGARETWQASYRNSPNRAFAKSYILRVYDVLARHNLMLVAVGPTLG